jgi:phosphomannomutase
VPGKETFILSPLIISVSGLRGVVGESLTPEVAIRYASAFARGLPPGAVLIGRDGRSSGPMLAAALTAALTALGRDVIDAGVVATPTLGVLVRARGAAAGIEISASHNPPQYNGLKLFSAEGRVLPAGAGQKVLEHYRQAEAGGKTSMATDWASYDQLGAVSLAGDTTGAHIEAVLRLVDVAAIRRRRFRVLLDANHGAGSVAGAPLLAELGCHTILIGGQADGRFAHTPEPTAENLSGILGQVPALDAQIGFCTDPDADRLAIIDERGRFLGEEYTLALCVDHVLRRRPGPIVTNCSTSRMSEDLATKYGVPFYRSAVGEANVVDAMLAHGAVLGGEGNGGVIDPRVVLVRDSIVGMAMVLDAMAARELPVGHLADDLPRYEIVKTKVTLPAERIADALASLEKHFAQATCDRLDGVRFDWPGKWLLVRASNTEPIVRAIAEAPTAAEALALCNRAVTALSAG